MAYTWTTGETITAEKLNNTGGGNPVAVVHTSGYSNFTEVGWFDIGKWDSSENEYVAVNYTASSNFYIDVLGVRDNYGTEYVFPSQFPASLPDGYALLFVYIDNDNVWSDFSGGISDTTYIYNNGSAYTCRVVTGNFEATCID